MKKILVALLYIFSLTSCYNAGSKVQIQMEQVGGVYQVPCKVNGVPMNFIFDTGASNVCISLTEALYLYKNGYITSSDLGSTAYSTVADGSIVENTHLNLRTLEVGGITINNVDAIVMSSLNAPLLLGQSAIQKLGTVEISGSLLTLYPNESATTSRTNKKSGIIVQIQDWLNDGWHYEGLVFPNGHNDRTFYPVDPMEFKLYSKSINGILSYQIKTSNGTFPVQRNPKFGENKNDVYYKYKYSADGILFNMPGDDVEAELAVIEAKKWVYIKKIYVEFINPDNAIGCREVELWWRAYDGKYKIKLYEYHRSEIMVEEVINTKTGTLFREERRGGKNYFVPYLGTRTYAFRAAEYSFNL